LVTVWSLLERGVDDRRVEFIGRVNQRFKREAYTLRGNGVYGTGLRMSLGILREALG